MASANAEHLRVESSFGDFYVSIDDVGLLWSNIPPSGAPYPPHPRLLLGKIVELLNMRGFVNGNYTIRYRIWVVRLKAHVSGLETTFLWSKSSEYTLLKVYLLVQDGKITSISNTTYPLEITAPIQLYNPILVNARK